MIPLLVVLLLQSHTWFSGANLSSWGEWQSFVALYRHVLNPSPLSLGQFPPNWGSFPENWGQFPQKLGSSPKIRVVPPKIRISPPKVEERFLNLGNTSTRAKSRFATLNTILNHKKRNENEKYYITNLSPTQLIGFRRT